ncbi:hypothetical protein HPP92_012040 [Vanilla planifolia]|uniref:GDSL esterase/lipase n=1 Tax=Vanilla planifolia TaxID=51239 RepID=A0A835V5L4_VANPL|nr:hypothetical protein HPP92_012040 [Vanilla planifolia]
MASNSFHNCFMVLLMLCLLLPLSATARTNAALRASTISTAPAVYILGDSIADVGNNNHLLTYLKSDFAHNGIDFAGGMATGRFSNGKNSADFIAENLGVPSPPAYLSVSSSPNSSTAFLNGVNFASAGAGILDSTHNGECLSLNKQINYLSITYAAIAQQIGEEQTQQLFAKSIFAITIGSNDVFAYVKSKGSNSTPQQLVASLISNLQGQLKGIYNIGARRIVFIGVGPLGCTPSQRRKSDAESCDDVANSVADLFNQAVASLLQEMKSQNSDMNYSFYNTSLALLEIIQRPSNYGFSEVKAACCGLGELNAKVACTPISSYCSNRRNHVFWDFVHPTEATARIIAADLFDGSSPHVFPLNLRQLSAL